MPAFFRLNTDHRVSLATVIAAAVVVVAVGEEDDRREEARVRA